MFFLEQVNEYLGVASNANQTNQEIEDVNFLMKLFCKFAEKEFPTK